MEEKSTWLKADSESWLVEVDKWKIIEKNL